VDGREKHPEWFLGPVQDMRGICELLDAIGWARMVPPVGARVDLRTEQRALMSALGGALEFAEADAEEAVRRDHAKQVGPVQRDAEIERVGALRDFIAEAQARIDVLTATEGEA
jgi:hypothetical protein